MANFPNDFKQVFDHIDKDGDGKLSSSELQLYVKSIGMDLSDEDVEDLVGFNEDGLLGYEEFARLVEVENGEEERVEELREAFGMFVTQGEECITAESLKRMLTVLGTAKDMEECRAMVRRFDQNRDGVLCFDEFKTMMSS